MTGDAGEDERGHGHGPDIQDFSRSGQSEKGHIPVHSSRKYTKSDKGDK